MCSEIVVFWRVEQNHFLPEYKERLNEESVDLTMELCGEIVAFWRVEQNPLVSD